jgi:pSer/pThr/pTyr-binding forkhead associated (FHA) protein
MTDPRLNSLHLDAPRREHYRRAREVLLQARGDQTVYTERCREAAPASGPGTVMQAPVAVSPGVNFWLQDRDSCIYPLEVGVNTIGRAPDNDVVVEDAFASRRHCAVLLHSDDGCELHDTASKNGTFLNGVRLTKPTRLRHGDEIRICETRLIFCARAGGAAGRLPQTLG